MKFTIFFLNLPLYHSINSQNTTKVIILGSQTVYMGTAILKLKQSSPASFSFQHGRPHGRRKQTEIIHFQVFSSVFISDNIALLFKKGIALDPSTIKSKWVVWLLFFNTKVVLLQIFNWSFFSHFHKVDVKLFKIQSSYYLFMTSLSFYCERHHVALGGFTRFPFTEDQRSFSHHFVDFPRFVLISAIHVLH